VFEGGLLIGLGSDEGLLTGLGPMGLLTIEVG
jgi:hypothetical protein